MATSSVEVFSDSVELKSVSIQRVWKAAFEDAHIALPKSAPHVVERVEYSEGSSFQPGSVRTVHFHKSHAEKVSKEKHPDHLVLFVKEKLVELNPSAWTLKVEIIEGGFLGILVKRYNATFHIKETGPTSCSVHWTFEYEALSEKHRHHVPLALKDTIPITFLDIQAFLLSHPEY